MQWGQSEVLPEGDTLRQAFEQLAQGGRFIVGGPESCARQMREHVERLGATTFLFRFQWPGMPQELVLASMRRTAEEVFPLVRGAGRTRGPPAVAATPAQAGRSQHASAHAARRGIAVSGRPLRRSRWSTGVAATSAIVKRPQQAHGEASSSRPWKRSSFGSAAANAALPAVGRGRLGAEPGADAQAERGLLDRQERGAQIRRDRVEQPVDRGAIGQVGRVDLRVARARREIAQDGVRLGQLEAVVDDRGDAAERVDGEVPVGPRLRERHLAQLGRLAQLGEQETHLLGVRRERVVVQHERHGVLLGGRRADASIPAWH